MPTVMLAMLGAAKNIVRIILVSEGVIVASRTMRSARTQRSQRMLMPNLPARSAPAMVAPIVMKEAMHDQTTRKRSKTLSG